MDLSGIISISGRPGLYKVIAQGKNSIIVESLEDKKRFPAYAADRISALDDISIYTYDGDKPLKEIFADIYAKQDGKAGPSHKDDNATLRSYLLEILPDYDEERVYPSDVKKLFQWYNMLLKSGNLTPVEAPEEVKEETTKEVKEKKASKAAPKKESKEKETKEKKAPAAKKKDAAEKKPAQAKKKPAEKKSK